MSSRLDAELGETDTKKFLTVPSTMSVVAVGTGVDGLFPLPLDVGALVAFPPPGGKVGAMPGVPGDGTLRFGGRVGGAVSTGGRILF